MKEEKVFTKKTVVRLPPMKWILNGFLIKVILYEFYTKDSASAAPYPIYLQYLYLYISTYIYRIALGDLFSTKDLILHSSFTM